MHPFLLLLILFLALAGLSWFFVPILSGIPWVPTTRRRVRRALEMAGLRPGETFVDLGCGDGRVLVAAARDFGARAVGIEISLLHCLAALARARLAGVGDRVRVRWGNIYRADLRQVDVAFQYGHSRLAGRLGTRLAGQLRDGARFVSIAVDFPGWKPEAIDREELIFLYRMPPQPGDVAGFLMAEECSPNETNRG
jgi:SAM-dependent methyltransferase